MCGVPAFSFMHHPSPEPNPLPLIWRGVFCYMQLFKTDNLCCSYGRWPLTKMGHRFFLNRLMLPCHNVSQSDLVCPPMRSGTSRLSPQIYLCRGHCDEQSARHQPLRKTPPTQKYHVLLELVLFHQPVASSLLGVPRTICVRHGLERTLATWSASH